MRQMQSVSAKALSFGKARARRISEKQNKVIFQDVAGIDEANEVGPVLVQHEERRVEDFAGIPAIDPFSAYLLRRQWRQVAVKDIKVHAGPDRADEVQVEDLVCLVAYQLPAGEVLGRIALVLNGDLPRVAGAVDGSDLHVGGAAGGQDVNECDAPRDHGHSRS